MNDFYQILNPVSQWLSSLREAIKPILNLAARLYIGKVFLSAGLTKIDNWETTLYLFEEEYKVPMINAEIAAYLGTSAELVFPVLLFAGLFNRLSASGLFIVNIVAVISLTEIPAAALNLHVIWGITLTYIAIYGGGFLSLDHYIKYLLEQKNITSTLHNSNTRELTS